MLRGLLVSHLGERCGVYQFGRRLFDAISAGTNEISWTCLECSSPEHLLSHLRAEEPDIILFNHVESTMPWLLETVPLIEGPLLFAVQHELQFQAVKQADPHPFHVLLCPDPTLFSADPRVIGLPRFIPKPRKESVSTPEIFTLSSFGFATPGKGFERLCNIVNDQFDYARIRINIPPHDAPAYSSLSVFERAVASCRRMITKPGVKLEATSKFMTEDELVDFLAESTINAFAYTREGAEGISSCIDYALAAGRPIAVNESPMFRHMHAVNPSIRLDERPLAEIASHGFGPLVSYRDQYSSRRAGEKWNRAILDCYRLAVSLREVPGGAFNRLLTEADAFAYEPTKAALLGAAPTWADKGIGLPQMFAFDAVKRLATAYGGPRILAIHHNRVLWVEALRADGYNIDTVEIDERGLLPFTSQHDFQTAFGRYNVVAGTEVLDFVENDDLFVADVSNLLAPGGAAILTVDAKSCARRNRKETAGAAASMQKNLNHYMQNCVGGCVLVDPPRWTDTNGRLCAGTWVFRKRYADDLANIRYPSKAEWPGKLEVGVELTIGVETDGLYPPEIFEGRPLRWTSDDVEIVVPLNPASVPETLFVRLWGISPPDGTDYRILINGVELLHGRVNGSEVEHLVRLPDLYGRSRLFIRLQSTGFEPPGDARVLGLALESISLSGTTLPTGTVARSASSMSPYSLRVNGGLT